MADKLVLGKRVKRQLEIDLPTGKTITFTLRNIKVKELPDHEKKMDELVADYTAKKINVNELAFGVFDQTLSSEWREHEKDLLELDSDDLKQIQDAVRDLKNKESEAQKKTA